MRRILVERARAKKALKRGSGAARVDLDQITVADERQNLDLLMLDEALNGLAKIDPRRGRVVELRYFGGLNNEEIAGVLKISENTVTRDWNMARAWLYQELSGSVA